MTDLENDVSRNLLVEHLTTSGFSFMTYFVTFQYLWSILKIYPKKGLFALKVLHIITLYIYGVYGVITLRH